MSPVRNTYTSPKKARTQVEKRPKTSGTKARLPADQMHNIIENIKNKYSKDVINEMSTEQLQSEVYNNLVSDKSRQNASSAAKKGDDSPKIEENVYRHKMKSANVIEDNEEDSVRGPAPTAQTEKYKQPIVSPDKSGKTGAEELFSGARESGAGTAAAVRSYVRG